MAAAPTALEVRRLLSGDEQVKKVGKWVFWPWFTLAWADAVAAVVADPTVQAVDQDQGRDEEKDLLARFCLSWLRWRRRRRRPWFRRRLAFLKRLRGLRRLALKHGHHHVPKVEAIMYQAGSPCQLRPDTYPFASHSPPGHFAVLSPCNDQKYR